MNIKAHTEERELKAFEEIAKTFQVQLLHPLHSYSFQAEMLEYYSCQELRLD